MGHLAGRIVGKGAHQPAGDLLRRPLLLQRVRHAFRQRRMQCQLTSLRSMRPVPCRLIRTAGAVALGAAVAPDFPADRRRRSAQRRCDRADRLAGNQRPRDVFALGQGQGPDRPASRRWPDTTGRREDPSNRRMMPIKQPGDLMERLAFLPPIPHQALLGIGVLDPGSSLQPQHSCCLGS